MKSLRKKTMSSLVAAALIVGTGAIGLAQPAQAAGPCGSAYSRVGSYPVKMGTGLGNPPQYWKNRLGGNGTVIGYLDVYWSKATKKNCAVGRYANRAVGQKIYSEVSIQISGASRPEHQTDGGYFTQYAGPVYTRTQSSGQCINVWFRMLPGGWDSLSMGTKHLSKVHCG